MSFQARSKLAEKQPDPSGHMQTWGSGLQTLIPTTQSEMRRAQERRNRNCDGRLQKSLEVIGPRAFMLIRKQYFC